MKVLITGVAGFIGNHLAYYLLTCGYTVVGIDNLNNYYSVQLKQDRLSRLTNSNFTLHISDISDASSLLRIFSDEKPDIVIHLAAQAGVRYSLENPFAYTKSNIDGFLSVLEACRKYPVKHLLYASSSSVYGGNTNFPFTEDQPVDHPLSLYAATKKSNELMAHSYSHLYRIPTTGLRFFTVYGPWGRPDMALHIFATKIVNSEPITLFNHGQMIRDFTYVDDIIESISRLLQLPPTINDSYNTQTPVPSSSWAPYRILNIGNGNPVLLIDYVRALETSLGVTTCINYAEMQPGDVTCTSSDTSKLAHLIGFRPDTPIENGIAQFVHWFKNYYQ